MTMQLDKRLNECARNLNDGKLLVVLSGGDVVAQELKYHYSCLTALYHKERAYLLTIENQDDSELSQDMELYPFVFSELLTYIVETKTNSDNPVVFRLADLVSLYKQRLEQLGMKTPDVISKIKGKHCLQKSLNLNLIRREGIFFWLSKKILMQPCHKHPTTQKLLSLPKLPRSCEDT